MPVYPCLGEGSPTKIDYRKRSWYPYSNLSTGGPSNKNVRGYVIQRRYMISKHEAAVDQLVRIRDSCCTGWDLKWLADISSCYMAINLGSRPTSSGHESPPKMICTKESPTKKATRVAGDSTVSCSLQTPIDPIMVVVGNHFTFLQIVV